MADPGVLLLLLSLALLPVSRPYEFPWSPLDFPGTSLSERQDHVTTRIHHRGQSDTSSGVVTHRPADRDSVRLVEVPGELWAGPRPVGVAFHCSANRELGLEVLVTTHTQVGVAIYRRTWSCPGPVRGVRWASVRFPDRLAFRPGAGLSQSLPVEGVVVRAWVGPARGHTHRGAGYQMALVKDFRVLSSLPPLSRPPRPARACEAWQGRACDMARPRPQPVCPAPQEPTVLLSSVLVLAGTHSGLPRRLGPIGATEIESARRRLAQHPRCAYTMDVMAREPCRYAFCSLLQRVNPSDTYSSPLVLLTSWGHLHVQVMLVQGEASAIKTTFRLPLRVWVRLHIAMLDRKVTISIAHGSNLEFYNEMVHFWPSAVAHDDTEGLLMIGGGQHTQGIVGYVSRVLLHRTHSPVMDTADWLGPVERDVAEFETHCGKLKQRLPSLLQHSATHLPAHPPTLHGTSEDASARLFARKTPPGSCDAREPIAARHRAMVALLRRHGNKDILHNPVPLAEDLYILARSRLIGRKKPGELVSHWLRQAGCLGQPRALFLLAVAKQVGLGVPANQTEALVLTVLATAHGSSLARASLGYKHQRGVDGAASPSEEPGGDLDMAYAYYSEAALTHSRQRQEHHPHHAYVELVRLSDDARLREQTGPRHDLFLWLKHQAGQGVGGAQQTLGRMLYWGQQGVARNVGAAARYYRRSATQTDDPTAMYDYAIVLMKGQGVKQNLTLAREYLEKAAAQDLPQAHNALGWFHQTHLGDYAAAVAYWERADALGNPDAPHNLGFVYASGLYPGNSSRQHAVAYAHYWRSAQRGHVDGAIRCADYWATGHGLAAPTSISSAVVWTRWVAEQSGELGAVLRRGLNAFLQHSPKESLVFYLMAAETGYEGAQFNVAYLSEQFQNELENVTEVDCARRYYGLSSQEDTAATHSLVKMGDHHYYGTGAGGVSDAGRAATAYAAAARRGDPEGWYSLGWLVEEGGRVRRDVWDGLGVPTGERHSAQKLCEYCYSRCRDHESDVAMLPCSLALARTQLHAFFRQHHSCLKGGNVLGVAVVTALTIMTLVAKLRDWAGTQVSHGRLNGGLPLANGSANQDGAGNSDDIPENSQNSAESEIPRIPRDGIPRVPGDEIPRIPGDEIPRVPGDGIPRIPGDGIPRIPGDEIPRIPEISQLAGSPDGMGASVVGIAAGIISGILVWMLLS